MTFNQSQWMVITDLDGTLLNHHTYDAGAAIPAIKLLQRNHIPIILNTSKTYAETLVIRHALDIHDPFIVENGSCVYMPVEQFPDIPANAFRQDDYWAVMLGKSYQEISSILDAMATPASSYTRFSQCTIEQAAELTGLTHDNVKLAINREFSEPIQWHASESALVEFKQQLGRHGLSTQQGGRFLHIMGDCGKGRAIKFLLQYYQGNPKTIILGDSANDAEMLSVADISVVVNSPSNDSLIKQITPDIRTHACAPEGWAEAIHGVLSDLVQIQE